MPSAAQQPNEDGVFVDPDSPTSKEYAVPEEEARRQAGGDGGSGAGGDSSGGGGAPLFGAGVEDGGGDRGDGRDRGDGGVRGTAESSSGPVARNARQALPEAVDAGASGTATAAGIAIAVLLVAVAIGLALRHQDRWPSPFGRRAA